ncbi:cobalamin B12-binding domain-containing protein [Elusimicrobiota bacterium]
MKILVAKPGLDGHDRGAIVVSQFLRDAGFEVIYTGIRQTVYQIIAAAMDEDVDVIGISCLSGAHLELTHDIIKLLKKKNISDKKIVIGGIIPEKDIGKLKKIGVADVFTSGTSLNEICERIKKILV